MVVVSNHSLDGFEHDDRLQVVLTPRPGALPLVEARKGRFFAAAIGARGDIGFQ